MKQPYPWFSETRSGGGWFVKIRGDQAFLGKHPDGAAKPLKRNGRWNPPSEILAEFHTLMAVRDTASKDDYPLDTVCALYVDELEETNPKLAKRYKQILGRFCDFVLTKGVDKGKRVGSLFVNAEAEGKHLGAWVEQFPSDQTRRSYINDVKTAFNWAVKKKGVNITHNPFLALKAPKIESRAVVITRTEHEALLKFWNNDCYCDFLQAMWFTGARPGEIAKIEARHFKDGLWLLEPNEHKTGRVTGKDRVIGVCDELYEVVDRLTKKHPTGPIFRNTYGRPWTTSASFVRFESARLHQIIRDEVSPYAYRHAWATHALEDGKLDVYEVAKALGHQTTQMVMLHYDHSRKNTDHLRDIFKRARGTATSGSADAPLETDSPSRPS